MVQVEEENSWTMQDLVGLVKQFKFVICPLQMLQNNEVLWCLEEPP